MVAFYDSSASLSVPRSGERKLYVDLRRTPVELCWRLARAADMHLPRAGKRRIPSVDWWITSRCNLACDFCYGPVPSRDPVERREVILAALRNCSAPW